MKAIMVEVPEPILAWRRRTGADRWDEMWEGVLHMAPMPLNKHQGLGGDLLVFLSNHWARPIGVKVYYEVNLASVGGWPDDYRIPDLLLLTRDRFHLDIGPCFEGAVNVAVEIQSPGDESEEKIPFYERLGVLELWIIDRDTKEPRVFLLKRGKYRQQPKVKGWTESPATGVEMRAGAGKLVVRLSNDHAIVEELPFD